MADYRIEERSAAIAVPLYGTDEYKQLQKPWRLASGRDGATVAGVESGELPFVPEGAPLPLQSIQGMPVASGVGLPWNRWTEIDSRKEGHFYERFAPGAFGDTLRNRSRPVIAMLDHGMDPQAGRKPLGRLSVWQDRDGLRYELAFIDAEYAKSVAAGVAAGLYGASVRFRTTSESVKRNPGRSAHNPRGLAERTVTGARLIELSMTAMPAYGGTSSSIAA